MMPLDLYSLNSALRDLAPALANHLWQSTAFAAVAGLLALVLRTNQARTRHWIWMAASLKFLLPFAMLAGIAGHFAKPRVVAPANTAVYSAVEDFSEPFAVPFTVPIAAPVIMRPHRSASEWLPIASAIVWLAGFVVALIVWTVRWRRVARTVRAGEPISEGREVAILRRLEQIGGARRPMRMVLSESAMEPGVFGIARPVLAWPAGISERLDDAHMETVLAHEVCHVRRWDNLTAMLHMFAEAAFWFHPLVWWMGARLVAERERACDEEVLQLLNRPQVYAESILKVCEFCVESPLECVAGVTGADLKKRIVEIMRARAVLRLTWGKKLLIGAAMVCAIAVPIVLGQAKAAQRLMLAAIKVAPKPIQFAAHAMVAEEQTPASGEIAASAQNSANREQSSPVSATASDSSPQFDAATIKPTNPNSNTVHMGFSGSPGGRVYFGGNARTFIGVAYGLQDYQVSGGPDWIEEKGLGPDWFAINAVPPDGSPSRNITVANGKPTAEQRRMLQSLLRDRFGLQCHFETKEGEVYFLTRGAKPLQFVAPKDPDAPPGATVIFKGTDKGMIEDGEARGRNTTIDYLAIQFSGYLRLPVINQTGITGSWDFHLDPVDPDNQDIPTAVYGVVDRLGLKIKRGRGPVQTLVIDHIEKPTVDGAEVQPTASVVPVAMVQEKAAASVTAKPSAFEAVTIKPNNSGSAGVAWGVSRTGYSASNAPLARIILDAYLVTPIPSNVRPPLDRVKGAPGWVMNAPYDITAKADETTIEEMNGMNQAQQLTLIAPMLRAMLEDRFKLAAHAASTEVQGYALVVGKHGIKMKEAQPGEPMPANAMGFGGTWKMVTRRTADGRQSGVAFLQITMAELAGFLGSGATPIIDQTSLTGKYDVELPLVDTGTPGNTDGSASVPQPDIAHRFNWDAAGLEMKPTKLPVLSVVIDHIERPTEN